MNSISTPAFALDPAAAAHLGFGDALSALRGLCPSVFGREELDAEPFPPRDELEARLDDAMEARAAVERRVAPPFGELRDVRPHLGAALKGVVLGGNDLLDIGRTLDALARIRDVLVFQAEASPRLSAAARAMSEDRRFGKRLLAAFDETGGLRDDASPELASARARVQKLRQEAQSQLEGLVRTFDAQGYLRDRNFTVRNDRYVLPVRSDVQGLVEGIVHDASQTHQTVFVEPRALLEIGNRIKIAQAQVHEEELSVLRAFGVEVAERADEIASDLLTSGLIEAAFARGAFARLTRGNKPRLDRDTLDLKKARHPLLSFLREREREQAAAENSGRAVEALVENDIGLGAARVLVISGPNGGGKTVALTTAGLIAVLVRAGVPVPVSPDSSVPVYAKIVCAMAGDQSLEAGLSTFQWHLVELKRAMEDAAASSGPTLCLVDEICSGTDPAEGTALAQAVLEELARHSRVIVTTHFERLKVLAIDPSKGGVFRNASFALSEKTGRPTFRLLLDQAGTSRALAAARDKGLPADVLARAEQLLSPDDKELQSALKHLSEQKEGMRARLEEVEAERTSLHAERERLARKLDDVEREAKRLRSEGKKAFLEELAEARRAVAEAIEATKGGSAKELDQQMKKLRDAERATAEAIEPSAAASALAPSKVSIGDVVELASMPGTRMNVVEVDGEDVVVAKGAMKTRTKIGALRVPGASTPPKESPWKRVPASKKGASVVEPRTQDNTLDVRGQRADEALDAVEAFLDRMMKEDRGRAFILHGHGGGALKGAIRKALGASRYVERHQPGDVDDGGDAWTVVTLAGG